jgi:xanthine/uracil/vitamin C permease (AzgA family)
VDWYLLRWCRIGISDGFQNQERHARRYCTGHNNLLAVSCLPRTSCTVSRNIDMQLISRNTSFTYFPHTQIGDDRFNFFKKVAEFHPIRTLNVLDWNIAANGSHFVLALFTFLYVDIIDCTATLYSMARFSGVVDPDTGDFPRSTVAYCTDAFCISIGALMGCSPVTAFIESGAGIAEGGKTGLTAITCGLCFFISMFFAPIFASIPPWATGSTLVLVSVSHYILHPTPSLYGHHMLTTPI